MRCKSTTLRRIFQFLVKLAIQPMNLFYTTNINGNLAELDAEEARHLKVLRKQIGDVLYFVDGIGGFYKAEILNLGKKGCTLSILDHTEAYNQRKSYLHIAIAPTKNIARLEWFLEKATEIGVDEITPILCEHSERKNIRIDRLNKIMVAAMKQSVKAYLPKLNDLTPFDIFFEKKENTSEQKFIAYCNDESLGDLKEMARPNVSQIILIGPEGDFSTKEIHKAKVSGFQGVSLGESRLRTETAGVVACTILNL